MSYKRLTPHSSLPTRSLNLSGARLPYAISKAIPTDSLFQLLSHLPRTKHFARFILYNTIWPCAEINQAPSSLTLRGGLYHVPSSHHFSTNVCLAWVLQIPTSNLIPSELGPLLQPVHKAFQTRTYSVWAAGSLMPTGVTYVSHNLLLLLSSFPPSYMHLARASAQLQLPKSTLCPSRAGTYFTLSPTITFITL